MRPISHAISLLTLLLCACGGSADDESTGPDGKELYRIYACTQCHGVKGEGSQVGLGPSLQDKGEYWDAERLDAYLLDPKGFAAGVERLGNAPTAMPAVPYSLSDEERAALVAYTLGLME